MKMKVDLSKFKLKDSDDSTATLIHPDGHEFRIAIKTLHPENRKNLANLEKMAEGGKVPDKKDKSPAIDQEKAKEIEKGATSSGWRPEEWKKNLKEGLGLAKGGKVPYAEGTDDVEAQPNSFPINTNPSQELPQAMVNPASVPDIQEAPPAQDPSLQQAQSQMQGLQQAPGSTSAEAPQTLAPQREPSSETGQQLETPSLGGAYQKQIQGIEQEAQAEANLGQEQAKALRVQALAQQDLQQNFQKHYNELDTERKGFQQDIIDKHIDPNRYLGNQDTGAKIATVVGLILGGMGSGMTGGENPALKFLNQQIDRDIDTQKADLNKKETLLSANMRQFGNLKDATDMTKVMMADQVSNQLAQAAARAKDPQAKARALQQKGAIEQSIAPLFQQLAQRRSLASAGNNGGFRQEDPSSYIPSVVPEHHQEAVYKEVERAQNVRNTAKTALENFDKYANQLKSGLTGRAEAAAYTPAELQALEAELGTTVGDQEGTVREAAMHNVKNAYLPKINDTAERLDKRREELVNYLKLKSAAPRAKSFGIDLDKFQSTSRNPEANFTPQQQAWLDYARKTGDTEMLKKLGVK